MPFAPRAPRRTLIALTLVVLLGLIFAAGTGPAFGPTATRAEPAGRPPLTARPAAASEIVPGSPGFGSMSGTSMATPHVTALVAPIKGLAPSLTPSQIRLLLAQNADKVGGTYRDVPNDVCEGAPSGPTNCSWNDALGYGRINVERTLKATVAQYGARPQVQSVSPAGGPESGGTTVTIRGQTFYAVQGVQFVDGLSSVSATSVKVISPTEITAVSPAGASGRTVDVTVTTPAGASATSVGGRFGYVPVATGSAPAAPSLYGQEEPSATTSVSLSWQDNSQNETRFEIRCTPTSSESWQSLTAPADTTWATISSLRPGTWYRVAVRACSAAGCSAWSAEAPAFTRRLDGSIPPRPR